MPTEAEEQQAKEFLKRAEIRTMHKDLSVLREADSVKERDKIATIKTLDEQEAAHQKELEARTKEEADKLGLQTILQKNETQEYSAEKDLKQDATEEERQQIFLFESHRVGLEKDMEKIDKETEPVLQLQKNQLLLQIQDWQKKLNDIVEGEKKLQGEETVIMAKEQTSAIPEERKALEARRGELDQEIQNTEKKRWEVEKQVQDITTKIQDIDKSSEQNTIEKNSLKDKILGIDKSLREIYSIIIARIEERRRGQTAEEQARRAAIEKAQAAKNESVQQSQRLGQPTERGFMPSAPESLKNRLADSAAKEAEERKKFLEDVGQGAEKNREQPMQKSNIN